MTTQLQTQTDASLPPEDPAQVAALAKAGEAAVNAGATHGSGIPQRPDTVPEKFWDPVKGQVNTEALLKSYSELERGRNTQPSTDPQKPAEEAPKAPDADQQKKAPESSVKIESVEQAQQVAAEKGIDFAKLATEYNASGSLSEDTLKSLEDKGIDRATVNAFIAGQQAIRESTRKAVFDEVGGEDQYGLMAKWAAANVSKAELAQYNSAIENATPEMAKFLASGLKARYEAANGRAPKAPLGGGTGGDGTAVQPFASRQQYVDAVKDAKYASDPAYRDEVIKRLAASTVF